MRKLLVWVAVALLLMPVCRAQELADGLGLDELDRASKAYDTGVSYSTQPELDRELGGLARRAGELLPGVLRDGIRSALLLLVVVLLCAMAQSVQSAGSTGTMPVAVMAGALAVTALSAGDMSAMVGLGRSSIDRMCGFSQVLLPVLAACSAAMGSAGAGAARQLATGMFANLLLLVIDRLLVPLVYAYIASCCAYAAVGNQGLKRFAELLKWVVKTALTTLLVAFMGYLTASGAVAGSADAAALRVAKTAISSVVPVVGGILSNAAESLLAGAGVLRSSVGIFGLLAVLGLCLVPFIQLGVHYLSYKVSAAVAATLADSRLAELIGGIGTAFGLILGMTGACAVLMLVGIMSGIGGFGS